MSNGADNEIRQPAGVPSKASFRNRVFNRKVAVLPNTVHDSRVLQSSTLLNLISKFSNRNILRKRPLCATDGTTTWLLASGTVGSQNGTDTIVQIDSLAPRHLQITLHSDTYFVQAFDNCQAYLKLPFDVGRKGFPLSKGDIIEMGPALLVTVLDIEIKTVTITESDEKLPPPNQVRFDQVIEGKTLVCIRNLSKPPKLKRPEVTYEPAKLVLQLHQTTPNSIPRIVTSPKSSLWFGSLHSSDIVCQTLDRLHAKIEFDGHRYLLKDYSHATRVVIGTSPIHIVPEDVIIVGSKALKIMESNDDALAAPGLEIQMLRISSRQGIRRDKHLPLRLDLPKNKLLHVGRSPLCGISLTNYTVKLVQFSILYENDRCWVMPLNGSLNQGLYRLLHRRERRRAMPIDGNSVPMISTTSSHLLLQKDMVIKIGCTELEVVYMKNQPKPIESHLQDYMNDRYTVLQQLPWFLLSQNLPCFFSETGHLASHCKVENIPAGEYIYGEGDDAHKTYVVMQGSVLLFRSREATGEKPYIESVERGGTFGEISIMKSQSKYTTNAFARCNVICMSIAARDLADYCGSYRDLYELPLLHGLHETTLIQALTMLPCMDLVSPAMIQRVALKMTRRSFLPETSLLSYPCSIFFIADGTIECRYDDGVVETQTNPFCFDRQTHFLPSLLSIQAVNIVQCLVLSLDDYNSTIGMTIKHKQVEHPLAFVTAFDTTPPNQNSKSLPVHRTSSTIVKSKQRKSSLARAKELWTGISTDDDSDPESNSPKAKSSSPTRPPEDTWRQKKRNAAMLQNRIEYIQHEATIERALVLYVLAGPNRGDVYVVRNTLTIGNSNSSSGLKLKDQSVSNQHAMIYHRNGKYWLKDCDSVQGTFVRLTDDEACCLHVGDVLIAGDTEFTIMGNPLLPTESRNTSCEIS